jgi:ABC-type uncharacterized transport system substrate-binding protein
MSAPTNEVNARRRNWLQRAFALASASAFALSCAPSASASVPTDLFIATADDGETTRRVVDDLRRRLPRAVVSDSKTSSTRRGLIIAVGPAALKSVFAAGGSNPVISIFTSSQVYHSIVESAGERRPQSTAIYAEPGPAAQLRLIRALFKQPVKTAVVLGGRTRFLEPFFRRAAEASRIPLTIDTLELSESINVTLSRTSDARVVIAVPDSLVYTSENLRTVLLTTYHNAQAVIGFSAALVRAGAMATTYSEVDDINAQLAELVAEYTGGDLPDPQFPKYFRTLINEDVARSLDIVVDEAARNFAHRPGGKS